MAASFFKTQEWKMGNAIKSEDLTEDEQKGIVLIPGQLVFEDLYMLSTPNDPSFAKKFGATTRSPKGVEDYMARLIAVVNHVGRKTWKREAPDRLSAIWSKLDQGVEAEDAGINIQDGDLHNPEFNRGCWVIKASRREDEGAPALFDEHNNPIEPWDVSDEDSAAEARQAGPQKGNLCWFVIRVWAQPKRKRVNFTLLSVHVQERTRFVVAPAVNNEHVSSIVAGRKFPTLSAHLALKSGAPSDEDGDEDDAIEAEVVKKTSKPAARVAAGGKVKAKKGILRSR